MGGGAQSKPVNNTNAPACAANHHEDPVAGINKLHDAAAQGSLECVKWFVSQGIDVNSIDAKGGTPLHFAAGNGHGTIIKELVQLGAEVDAQAKNGATPLHSAAGAGRAVAVKALMQAGADIVARTKLGTTPLHSASLNGHAEIIKIFQQAGCDLDVCDEEGATPLHWGALHGHLPAAEMLLECGANPSVVDTQGFVPLLCAIKSLDTDVLNLFLRVVPNDMHRRDATEATAVHIASMEGQAGCLWALLRANPQAARDQIHAVDYKGNTPLHYTALYGFEDAAIVLLGEGAKVDSYNEAGHTAFRLASDNGHALVAAKIWSEATKQKKRQQQQNGQTAGTSTMMSRAQMEATMAGGFVPRS